MKAEECDYAQGSCCATPSESYLKFHKIFPPEERNLNVLWHL